MERNLNQYFVIRKIVDDDPGDAAISRLPYYKFVFSDDLYTMYFVFEIVLQILH